jgi:hypothetical protein
MLAWIQDNWEHITAILLGAHALASAITAATSTPKDDAAVSKIYKVIEMAALVVGKAKQDGQKADEKPKTEE